MTDERPAMNPLRDFNFKPGDRVGRLFVRGEPAKGHGPMAGTVERVIKRRTSGRATARVRVRWDSGSSASHENVCLTLFNPNNTSRKS